jgi:hypothetical protein
MTMPAQHPADEANRKRMSRPKPIPKKKEKELADLVSITLSTCASKAAKDVYEDKGKN